MNNCFINLGKVQLSLGSGGDFRKAPRGFRAEPVSCLVSSFVTTRGETYTALVLCEVRNGLLG